MPELPEVETTLRGISPYILQQPIVKVVIRHPTLRWPIPTSIKRVLLKQCIIDIQRRAKYLLLKTNVGTLLIHLGMSGSLRILSKTLPPQKHDHIDIEFANKKILRFTDPRRFGAFLWIEGGADEHPLLKYLGPEPLTANFSGKYLHKKAEKRNVSVKNFIMDNKIVTGVGNIYAAEALFMSDIHPLRSAKSLSLADMEKLVQSIKTILKKAIKQGGTTLKDFLQSDGKPGYFVNQLQVYGRAGLPCYQCKNTLETIKIGQRSTVFCGRCQQ